MSVLGKRKRDYDLTQYKYYSNYLQREVYDYYFNVVMNTKDAFERYDELPDSIKDLVNDIIFPAKFSVKKFIDNLLTFDFLSVIRSSYTDYSNYIDDTLYVYRLTNHLQSKFCDLTSNRYISTVNVTDVIHNPTLKLLSNIILALSNLGGAIDNIYQMYNSLSFVIPYRRFEAEPLMWSNVNLLLDKLEKMDIDTLLFNIETENGYAPYVYKLSRADWNAIEVSRDSYEPLPDATSHTTVWRLARICEKKHTKEIILIPLVDTPSDRIGKVSAILNDETMECFKEIEKEYKLEDDSIVNKYLLNINNLKCFGLQENTLLRFDEENNIKDTNEGSERLFGEFDNVCRVIKMPFLKFFPGEEKDEISYVFQALNCFVSRRKIYKDRDISKITKNRTTKDVAIIDEDSKDIIKETSKDGVVQIRDIVIYETSNGKRFHTHHKHPRRHYVRAHQRVSKTGKVSVIPGFWRGGTEEEKRDIIYKV